MNDNVFFVSDASLKKDHTAILAIKDMKTRRTKQKIVSVKVKNSLIAEELALRFAIQTAIDFRYKHVVFIYDCLAINTDKFLKRYSKYFKTMQFLWLKRKHISDIDEITKFQEDKRLISIRLIPDHKQDEIILEILSKYVVTMKEINVFSYFLKDKKYNIHKEKRTTLFSLTYFLLSRVGKKKFKKVLREELSSAELKKVFRLRHVKEYKGLIKEMHIQEEFINNILKLRARKINQKNK
jgi:hypothetical protein